MGFQNKVCIFLKVIISKLLPLSLLKVVHDCNSDDVSKIGYFRPSYNNCISKLGLWRNNIDL